MASIDHIRFQVRLTKCLREAAADGDTPLLAVGEDAGMQISSGCRMGICFSCLGGSAQAW